MNPEMHRTAAADAATGARDAPSGSAGEVEVAGARTGDAFARAVAAAAQRLSRAEYAWLDEEEVLAAAAATATDLVGGVEAATSGLPRAGALHGDASPAGSKDGDESVAAGVEWWDDALLDVSLRKSRA